MTAGVEDVEAPKKEESQASARLGTLMADELCKPLFEALLCVWTDKFASSFSLKSATPEAMVWHFMMTLVDDLIITDGGTGKVISCPGAEEVGPAELMFGDWANGLLEKARGNAGAGAKGDTDPNVPAGEEKQEEVVEIADDSGSINPGGDEGEEEKTTEEVDVEKAPEAPEGPQEEDVVEKAEEDETADVPSVETKTTVEEGKKETIPEGDDNVAEEGKGLDVRPKTVTQSTLVSARDKAKMWVPDPIDDVNASPDWVETARLARQKLAASAKTVMRWSGVRTDKVIVTPKNKKDRPYTILTKECFKEEEVAAAVMCFGHANYVECCLKDMKREQMVVLALLPEDFLWSPGEKREARKLRATAQKLEGRVEKAMQDNLDAMLSPTKAGNGGKPTGGLPEKKNVDPLDNDEFSGGIVFTDDTHSEEKLSPVANARGGAMYHGETASTGAAGRTNLTDSLMNLMSRSSFQQAEANPPQSTLQSREKTLKAGKSVASGSLELDEVGDETFINEVYEGQVANSVDLAEAKKILFSTLEKRAMDKSNWLQRRRNGDKCGKLKENLSAYVDACYWDFLTMVIEPAWPELSMTDRLTRRSTVLSCHQASAKDSKERCGMAKGFEIAWADFFETIVKIYLPEIVPKIQEFYDEHMVVYPPVVSVDVKERKSGSTPVSVANTDGVGPGKGEQLTKAPLTDVGASVPTGGESRPVSVQRVLASHQITPIAVTSPSQVSRSTVLTMTSGQTSADMVMTSCGRPISSTWVPTSHAPATPGGLSGVHNGQPKTIWVPSSHATGLLSAVGHPKYATGTPWVPTSHAGGAPNAGTVALPPMTWVPTSHAGGVPINLTQPPPWTPTAPWVPTSHASGQGGGTGAVPATAKPLETGQGQQSVVNIRTGDELKAIEDNIISEVGKIFGEKIAMLGEQTTKQLVEMEKQIALVKGISLSTPLQFSTPGTGDKGQQSHAPLKKKKKTPIRIVLPPTGTSEDSDEEEDEGLGEVTLNYAISAFQSAKEMAKSIGHFTEPSGIHTWGRYVGRFEKATERHDIKKERWGAVMPDMLKGEARVHLDGEVESLNRNLAYQEIVDLLKRVYREFNAQSKAGDELARRKQLDGEGIAAFASVLKRLATKAFPESATIRLRTVRERLSAGLRDEALQFECKRKIAEDEHITVAALEKALCFLEPDPEKANKASTFDLNLAQETPTDLRKIKEVDCPQVNWSASTTNAINPVVSMTAVSDDAWKRNVEKHMVDVSTILKEMQEIEERRQQWRKNNLGRGQAGRGRGSPYVPPFGGQGRPGIASGARPTAQPNTTGGQTANPADSDRPARRMGRCHHCGKEGHWERECFRKKEYLRLCYGCVPKHDKMVEEIHDCFYCMNMDFALMVREQYEGGDEAQTDADSEN